MPSSNVYKPHVTTIHGLELRTPFEVWPSSLTSRRQWSHQVNVSVSLGVGEEAPLCGALVAEALEQGQRMYAFARTGSRIEFSFPELCRGHVDIELGQIELCSEAPDTAALVVPNTILAVLLGHLGALTLHGSAVRVGDRTVAFCGPSTAGKTTCAAALCLRGAHAVTDDLLRVELERPDTPVCFPGIPEFRLRSTHGWELPADRVRNLIDERTGFTPHQVWHDKSLLGAIVFPTKPADGGVVALRRVQGEPAVRRLLQSSRIAWAPRFAVGFLRQLSLIATQVELYELQIELSRLRDPLYLDQFAHVLSDLAGGYPDL